MSETDQWWQIPGDLSPRGRQAAEIIYQVLSQDERDLRTGGQQVFRSPAEQQAMGEEYGLDSLLVIMHDGGNHASFFTGGSGGHSASEELKTRLAEAGLYYEPCTTWYSAVYES